MEDKSDHDLLIEVNVKQDIQIEQFKNHLHHHFLITIAAISAGLMGTASFIVGLLLLIFRKGM